VQRLASSRCTTAAPADSDFAGGAREVPDPILEAIARVDAARARWEVVATDPSAEWHATKDAVLATVPSSLPGIAALITWAKREHYFDDDTADELVTVIERAVAHMVDRA